MLCRLYLYHGLRRNHGLCSPHAGEGKADHHCHCHLGSHLGCQLEHVLSLGLPLLAEEGVYFPLFVHYSLDFALARLMGDYLYYGWMCVHYLFYAYVVVPL